MSAAPRVNRILMFHVKQINQYIDVSRETLRDKDGVKGRSMTRKFLRMLALTVMTAAIAAANLALPTHAQEPVRVIFPFTAGGSGDALARHIAEGLRMALDQPVIVENRTGAQGRLGVQAVKAAAPDGKTLLLTPVAPMSVYAHVYKALLYDPVADFEPVSQVATFDFAIAVGPQVPAASLKELVAWVKANPAQGNYGTPAAGTLPHFFAVSFAKTAGLDLRHVGYRGSAAALTDLVGGQISIVVTTTSDVLEQHKAGRIRVLATSDKARSPFLPDIPTFKQAGYDIEGSGWYGVYVPAKTPPDVVAQLNKAIVAAVQSAPVKEKLLAFGLVPSGTTATELRKIQAADSELWAPAVRASGFTPEQ